MRRAVSVAACLVVVAAGCNPQNTEQARPDGPASSDSPPTTLAEWISILDDELPRLGGAATWNSDSEVHVVALCGPADEIEGWQVLATLGPGIDAADLDPPADVWVATVNDGSQTIWQHRDHEHLTLVRVRSPDDYVMAQAASPGADLREWAGTDLPGEHPRVHPQPLDPATNEPRYCG